MISKDTHNVTSSQELVGGQLPLDLQDGQMTSQCGQEAAPASPSARRGSKKAKQMIDISGQTGSGSLQSAVLQSFMESKCEVQYVLVGGMMLPMIWKELVTPRGRKLGQLVVSVHPTKEKDCGLLPTPRATKVGGYQSEKFSDNLVMRLSKMYPTPSASDSKGAGAKRFNGSPESHGNLREVLRSGITDGQYPHPKFVAWLMGYSEEHLSSMLLAMPSFRKSRRSS